MDYIRELATSPEMAKTKIWSAKNTSPKESYDTDKISADEREVESSATNSWILLKTF